MQGIILTLAFGAIAGWLAGQLFKGSGFGVLGNVVIGIIGGFAGYWIFYKLGINLGRDSLYYIFIAAIGAVILLAITNIIFKGK